jgi:hypothetical protein
MEEARKEEYGRCRRTLFLFKLYSDRTLGGENKNADDRCIIAIRNVEEPISSVDARLRLRRILDPAVDAMLLPVLQLAVAKITFISRCVQ